MSQIKNLIGSLVVGVLLLQSPIAFADDLAPPSWDRYEPYTTVQEWEFFTPGEISPDGDSVELFNPNGDPSAFPLPFGITYLAGPPGFPEFGGYLGDVGGGNILFSIPNRPDDRPVKHLHIQISGIWEPGFVPVIDDLFGTIINDPPEDDEHPLGVFIGSDETNPGFHRWEDWDIYPNPDFENLSLFIPEGAFVNQVVIDTISAVPLPPAVVLFGSALVGLVGMARRKNTVIEKPAA